MKELLSVDGILGPRGALAAALPDFEYRPEQLEVARAVESAFSRRQVLLAEAGTGTGKTLAYLIPAVLSGRRVVISTATKNLQEQIFLKDIPLLRDALGLQFRAAYLKGRSNYLCLHRYEARAASPVFERPEEATLWPRLVEWAGATATGDRAELDLPEDFAGWRDLSATPEECLGSKCPVYESCFVTRMRREAEDCDVLVVNHHLFFADLALRSRPGGRGEGVLPGYEAVVFDEAHALEEIAAGTFGAQVSSWRLSDFCGDAQRASVLGGHDGGMLSALAARLRWSSESFFKRSAELLRLHREGSVRMAPGALSGLGELDEILETLSAIGSLVGGDEGGAPELQALARRSGELAEQLELIARSDDPGQVHWAEARGRGLFLRATPIEVGDDLRRTLHAGVDTLVFTSATLTANGDFGFFSRAMGLSGAELPDPPSVETVCVASPFDYPRQAALYVPDHLPDPAAPHFAEEVAEELVALSEITGGRAFALFTSLRNMEAAWRAAKDRLGCQVLMQGERPKSALLEAFRSEPSVLFASHSFWEGVDVPGDALSLVVIDKLPFGSPGDPRVAARIELMQQRGEDAFSGFQLPEAAIALRQGFGRLIRSTRDRGIVAILDPRLRSRGYGRGLLRSLPPAHRVADREELRAWFQGAASTARATSGA